jgi:hypothetical protein
MNSRSVGIWTAKHFFLFPLERQPVQSAVSRTLIIPEGVHDFVEGKLKMVHNDPAVVIPMRANQANSIVLACSQETPAIEHPMGA